MSDGHKRIAEVAAILGRLGAFFPAWKPSQDEMKAWVQKMLGIAHLDLEILRASVEKFIDERNSPYPPSFADIRHEHERRLEDRMRAQRKLAEPEGNFDVDAARKAREFVNNITRAVRNVPEAD